ncbi:hypothetical protein WJX74_007441 [Apatococcus lobatus]|uniref:NADPH:adrenodoxin oxidoreductase, mitochondrial n=1 Tax=Apatococcus lobatus TaxID=904363 RepID=A0AAW1QMD8_9CHLO
MLLRFVRGALDRSPLAVRAVARERTQASCLHFPRGACLKYTNHASLPSTSAGAGAPLHFCVVGSGPAGFYATERLLKQLGSVASVSLLDRLPHPYGLVRTGVAPDHADTKNVIKQFQRAAQHPNFHFFGNVNVGQDISVAELQSCYHAVILAYGAESHNKLNVAGEDLRGVLSAREFVEWYNGHPDAQDLPVNLNSVQAVAICGLGNVAVDCARILLQKPARLEFTDIAEHALAQLRCSAVRSLHLIGRRGVTQAAFTPKELRELVTLPNVHVHMADDDLLLDEAEQAELKIMRMKRRIYDIIANAAKSPDPPGAERSLHLDFKRSLAAIHGGSDGQVEALDLEVNDLVRDPVKGTVRAQGTGRLQHLQCDMILGSIGYCSVPLPGVPFDSRKGIIPNSLGRVLRGDETSTPTAVPGLYTVGWVKRGPTGIIGSNLVDAQQTVECIKEDIGRLPPLRAHRVGAAALQELLQKRCCRAVSFENWSRIDAVEVSRGLMVGKPREKFTSASAMLACL